MKRILSLVLAVLMLAAMLCACSSSEPSDTNPDTNPPETNTDSGDSVDTSDPGNSGEEEPAAGNTVETKVITLSEYFADGSKWEDDGGYYDMDAEKIFFDNGMAGDYAAVRLTEEAQNVTYKFTVTINKLADGVSMEDYTWWDSELMILARSSVAGSSWYDDGTQTGYCLTAWGDMSEVCIGRAGYDDAFGTYEWSINDGEPHEIELSVINNEDNSAVTVTLVVDGVEIASIVDEGTAVKNDRPALYPEAGGLTIRCKWLEATIE